MGLGVMIILIQFLVNIPPKIRNLPNLSNEKTLQNLSFLCKITGSHAPVRHWVVGNIDGLSLQLGDLAASETVSPFKGPSPPYGSHRYGFFLFRQFEGNTIRNI